MRPLDVASPDLSVLTRGRDSQVGRCGSTYWRKFWAGWLVTFLVTGVVGDALAYVQGGYQASLTGSIRRLTGQEPRTKFGRLGQVALMAFLAWATVHLGFGVWGPTRGRP